jgi:autotransporter translocation and assembly factor TamB
MKNWILFSILSLLVASCDKEKQECPGSSEKTFAITGFTKVTAGDAHRLTINKGNGFSIKAIGCTADLNDLELTLEANHILNIHYKNHKQNRYRVDFTVTMPQLIAANLSGASNSTINGFGGQNTVIRTVLSGASECTVAGTGINATLEISGASKLVLSGNTQSLAGNISGASLLEAYDVAATEVDISVSGSSKAYVRPIQALFAEATGNSRIYYKGNPPTKHLATSGNGKIIQE